MAENDKQSPDKEQLLKKFAEQFQERRKWEWYITFILLSVTIIATTYYALSLSTTKKDIENLMTTHAEIRIQLDSIESVLVRQDSMKNYIAGFLRSITKDSSVEKYFSPVVSDYYLQKNFTWAEIKKSTSSFNRQFPNSKLDFSLSDIFINSKKDSSEVFVDALFYPLVDAKPKEVVFQLKLNNKKKVYYIRNLKAKTFDKTFDDTFQ